MVWVMPYCITYPHTWCECYHTASHYTTHTHIVWVMPHSITNTYTQGVGAVTIHNEHTHIVCVRSQYITHTHTWWG